MDLRHWNMIGIAVGVIALIIAGSSLTDSHGNKSKLHSTWEMICYLAVGIIAWTVITLIVGETFLHPEYPSSPDNSPFNF